MISNTSNCQLLTVSMPNPGGTVKSSFFCCGVASSHSTVIGPKPQGERERERESEREGGKSCVHVCVCVCVRERDISYDQ